MCWKASDKALLVETNNENTKRKGQYWGGASAR